MWVKYGGPITHTLVVFRALSRQGQARCGVATDTRAAKLYKDKNTAHVCHDHADKN